MLTEKKNRNDVVTVKLVSGEEVIGYFFEEDSESITVRKPLVPVPAGDNSMMLAPFVMSGGSSVDTNLTVKLNKQTVVTVLDTNQQFVNNYTSLVSKMDLGDAGSQKSGLIW